MFDTVNGLPAHPLFVHAPVALVPLVAVFAIAAAVRPSWRRAWGVRLALATLAVLIATQMAVMSGEWLADLAGDAIDVTRHRSLGTGARNLLIGATVLAAATAWFDRRSNQAAATADRSDGSSEVSVEHRPLGAWFGAAAAVVLVAATVWIVRAGDEGARLVWEPVIRSLEG